MIISTRSKHKIYHQDNCPYANRIRSKYQRHVTEIEAKNRGYGPCSFCGGLHGIYLNLQMNPDYYIKVRKPMEFYWDKVGQGLCIQTKVGFWKIVKSWNTGKYALYHLNRTVFEAKKNVKERMDGRHHRQTDVEQTESIQLLLHYISEHDRAKQIMQERDYRALPQKTKKQKKYFARAKKKAIREKNRRIDELFEQIQNGSRKG